MSIGESDEAERLRLSDDEDAATIGRNLPDSVSAGATVLAVTKTVTSYPATAGKFFACETRRLLGSEVEGAVGSGANVGDTFYAYLPSGRTIPASGTEVVCERVPYRWLLDY